MENNIIKTPNHTIIMNGGNALEGCPANWDEAHKWQDDANVEKESWRDPKWSFDCGFKLDFDGPIIRVSSRFYPPKTHYGPTWDGTVNLMIGDDDITEKKFDCKTLDELQIEVEKYVADLKIRLTDIIRSGLAEKI